MYLLIHFLLCSLLDPTHQPCRAITKISHPSGLFGRKTDYAPVWLVSHTLYSSSQTVHSYGDFLVSVTYHSQNKVKTLENAVPWSIPPASSETHSASFFIIPSFSVTSWLQICRAFPTSASRSLSAPCHDTPLSLLGLVKYQAYGGSVSQQYGIM